MAAVTPRPQLAATMVLADDRRVYDALRTLHRLRGWDVVRTPSLEEAVRMVAVRSEIDVVCVDVTCAEAAEFLSQKSRHPAVARLRVFLVDAEMKQDLRSTASDLVERIAAHRDRR